MSKVGGSYSYNIICQVCGFKYKAHEIKKRWDGIYVCKYDWEPRHPMDFFRQRNDTHTLPVIFVEDSKKRVKATVSADVTPVVGVWTTLVFDSELADTYGEYTPGTGVFQPSVSEARAFNVQYTLSQTNGSSSCSVAIYKNGSPFKVFGPVSTYGPSEIRIGGSVIDSTSLLTDQYTCRYLITTTDGVIKAYENTTCLEIK